MLLRLVNMAHMAHMSLFALLFSKYTRPEHMSALLLFN
jgi:hypothetical protein